ncbi:Synaptotagmin-like mitochondrial-lipid-binding domain [Sesbania bispinosa]|nr:Synaptotagmin-like mitochondrial-lipid-binding domain [Sesbania bispinosa]
MSFLTVLLGFLGFGIGIPLGIFLGFFTFVFFEPPDVKDPIIRNLRDADTNYVLDVLPDVPAWMKHPDFDRIDWLNKFVSDMWPYLNKAICNIIRQSTMSIVSDYIGKFTIKSVEFKNLTLGTLPPIINGVKVHENYENGLLFEPAVRWAGNPDISLVLTLLWLPITVQLVDVQIFAAPRIILRPLLPTFPCFGSIVMSLLEKPHVDFGLKLMGMDIMAIPGLYQYIQRATKRPVGILYVKIVRALKLLKMDLLGTSDPYVKLSLSGDGLPAKRTSIKMKNLNPEWNEEFKLTVKDPESQVLQLHVYDWEKVGIHDKLGMQVVPLRLLTPHETKEFTLNLVKNTNPNDPHNKKWRGQLVVKLTFNPFKDNGEYGAEPNGVEDLSCRGFGLLMVTIQSAEDVEGKHHTNPFALITYRGEKKKTKMIMKTRNPSWNEEFQFLLEEAPVKDKIHIEVMSKRRGFSLRPQESLGYVDIDLVDVVHNGHINERYDLIKSREGVIHVDIRWNVI